MPEIKPHLIDLHRTGEVKSRYGTLRLDMNESVAGLPNNIVKEALGGVDSEFLAAYPEYNTLAYSISRHNRLRPDNICLSNGSDAAIKYIFDAYILPGDKVLFASPTFAMYPVYCSMFNAQPVSVDYNDDLSFPYERYSAQLTRGVKLAILVNPNNPTGSMIARDGVLALLEKARRHRVLLLVDEAYFYFCPTTVIDQIKRFDNLIVLRTFSKLCGLAAARIGYAAACPEIIQALRKVKPSYDVNGLAVRLAKRVIERPSVIKKLIEDASKGKMYLVNALNKEGIHCIDGHANFLLISCNGREALMRKRLKQKKVLVGGGFQQHYLQDYIRVTVGDMATMKRFFRIFSKIWNETCRSTKDET